MKMAKSRGAGFWLAFLFLLAVVSFLNYVVLPVPVWDWWHQEVLRDEPRNQAPR